MATTAPFIPIQPPRTAKPVPVWCSMFGARMRNSIYGFAEAAFDDPIRTRTFMGYRLHILADPAGVQRVLLDNKANYVRPSLALRILRPLVGNGLLSAEGDDWKVQRRIVAPTFAPGAVAKMTALIGEASAGHVARWPQRRTRIDMAKVATDTTMAIIAAALFSGDKRLTSAEAALRIEDLINAGGQARMLTILGLSDFDISPGMRRARAGREFLRSTLTTMVRERGAGGGGDDFFGGLIRSLHEQFPAAEAETLAVDNAVTFYIAGHETTANALAWAIYLLAAQPALQDEARTEAVAALGGNLATIADRSPTIRAIIDEAMRLYPPAPNFSREAVSTDELCGTAIAPGDLIAIFPWIIHRHRKLWRDPDTFDHTRFLGDAKSAVHKFAYLPFGGGPRVCVGQRFAIVEAVVILTQWLAARRFSLPDGFRPDPVGSVTLRPRGGMPLWVDPV